MIPNDCAILARNQCPVCRCNSRRPLARPRLGRPWKLSECQACRFVYLAQTPEVDAIAEHFPWEETLVAEKQRRDRRDGEPVRRTRRLLAMAKRALKRHTRRDKVAALSGRYFEPGPVIDIGCGDGGVIHSLPESCEPHGVELSPGLATEAERCFASRGGTVVEADAISGLRRWDDGFFSGALARSFLEHEPRPLEMLRETRRVLRPSGRLILKLPNYGCVNRKLRGDHWCGWRFPDHVNYFTPRTLRRILADARFRIVRFNLADRFPASDNMWCVAERK